MTRSAWFACHGQLTTNSRPDPTPRSAEAFSFVTGPIQDCRRAQIAGAVNISLLPRHPLDQKFVVEKVFRTWPLIRKPAKNLADECEEELFVLSL